MPKEYRPPTVEEDDIEDSYGYRSSNTTASYSLSDKPQPSQRPHLKRQSSSSNSSTTSSTPSSTAGGSISDGSSHTSSSIGSSAASLTCSSTSTSKNAQKDFKQASNSASAPPSHSVPFSDDDSVTVEYWNRILKLHEQYRRDQERNHGASHTPSRGRPGSGSIGTTSEIATRSGARTLSEPATGKTATGKTNFVRTTRAPENLSRFSFGSPVLAPDHKTQRLNGLLPGEPKQATSTPLSSLYSPSNSLPIPPPTGTIDPSVLSISPNLNTAAKRSSASLAKPRLRPQTTTKHPPQKRHSIELSEPVIGVLGAGGRLGEDEEDTVEKEQLTRVKRALLDDPVGLGLTVKGSVSGTGRGKVKGKG